MNYRKKPVEVEARRVNTDILDDLADWCGGEAIIDKNGIDSYIEYNTLEGNWKSYPGSWIIKGVAGEFYPCDNEVFQKTYEPVIDNQASMVCICNREFDGETNMFCPIHGQYADPVLT